MRYFFILVLLVLTGCATPKTAPNSFYGDVYTPGQVSIGEDGTYSSVAGVFDEEEKSFARKAAFARLLLAATDKNYAYFQIDEESESWLFGHRFTVTGKVYQSDTGDKNVYPITDIRRLLQDLPLERPKPVAAVSVARPAPRKPVSAPSPAVEASPPTQQDEPLVIMAPEDITGSISNSGTREGAVAQSAAGEGPSSDARRYNRSGVVYLRNR